ncbi:hypothetical protein [Bythopirellula polymerisocia]|uniref:Uncharacterized protein n=1 Tax=Bythopirellula polymerisocia TaxID=2528003 RepID=A0A5C6CZU2_9BACT|nr:hypothetical protein [Bythopirellula polymerisocia]TWU29968.1 hypothetical protein Pla144_07490 [Bythopirellula polymerisocia]
MAEKPNYRWLPLILIAGALAVWGLLLAWGAYQAPAGGNPGHDRRKLWVVAATTGGFLGLWALALWMGRGRMRKK